MELDGAQYLGFRLPFTISQLTVIEVILVGGAEIYRNRARGLETRIYPGTPWSLERHDIGPLCPVQHPGCR